MELLFQSPTGVVSGMAQGTTSLLSNTVFAISDAATQFSRAAHKVCLMMYTSDQLENYFLRLNVTRVLFAGYHCVYF